MGNDEKIKTLLNEIAEILDEEADSIPKEEQQLRDAFQRNGRILSDEKQEWLNNTIASSRETGKELREMAAQLRIRAKKLKKSNAAKKANKQLGEKGA